MRVTQNLSGKNDPGENLGAGLGSPADGYWGEVAIHFAAGRPLLLSIGENERRRLSRQLKSSSEFFHVFTRSNQMIAVRRSAVTDMCLADDECDTFGPEHDSYPSDGVWQHTESAAFWQIAGELLRDSEFEELEEQFGKDEVAAVARTIGVSVPDEIDALIDVGTVDAADHEAVLASAERMRERVEHLTCQIIWQLSTGKVRRSECLGGADLSGFEWIENARDPKTPGQMIVVDDPEAHMSLINVGALDYIALPRHRYFAWKEQNSA